MLVVDGTAAGVEGDVFVGAFAVAVSLDGAASGERSMHGILIDL